MNLGMRIRAAREAREWSQERLGRAAGVVGRTISKWERGDSEPNNAERARLAHALGINPATLGVLVESEATPTVKVMGIAEAGQAVRALAEALFIVNPPAGVPPGAECVLVQGDALQPFLPAGAALIFWRWAIDPFALLGRLCVVELTDGRLFVRVLERGSGQGLWTLAGWGSAPLRDVRIKRAAPVDYSIPFPNEILKFEGTPPISE